jgi:hypothetical protein
MTTMLEGYNTEEQRSLVHFLWAKKDSVQRIFIKKYFLFTVESVCCIKGFTAVLRNTLKDVQKSQMMKQRCGIG